MHTVQHGTKADFQRDNCECYQQVLCRKPLWVSQSYRNSSKVTAWSLLILNYIEILDLSRSILKVYNW